MERHMGIINIALYFVIQVGVGSLLYVLYAIKANGFSEEEFLKEVNTINFIGIIAFVTIVVILLINFKTIRSKISYGIEKWKQTLAYGILGYLVMIIINIILAIALIIVGVEASNPENEQTVQSIINSSPLISSILVIGIITPFLEEIIFRTSILAVFTNDIKTKKIYPYILCALVFALIHDQTIITSFSVTSIVNFLSYFCPSMVLVFVYRFTNHNLLAVFLVHMLNNTVPFLLLGVVS